jgi:hypothetical protein
MSDRPRFETEEGIRPSASGGERILIALAFVVLAAGLLMAVGKLFPPDETAILPSRSPFPTLRPVPAVEPTPAPTPKPVDLVLDEVEPPAVRATETLFSGWIRAKEDLPILALAVAGGLEIGSLAAGEPVYAWEQPGYAAEDGWLQVVAEPTQDSVWATGWIATRREGIDLVERFPDVQQRRAGGAGKIVAGGNGFVGIASPPGSGFATPSILIESADGGQWRTANLALGPSLSPEALAWGPIGWLVASTNASDEFDRRIWISSSDDRATWVPLGATPARLLSAGPGMGRSPVELVASDRAYLLKTETFSGTSGRQAVVLRSTDGLSWRQVSPGLTAQVYSLVGFPGGFYAWTNPDCCHMEAAYSADGLTWTPVSGGPVDNGVRLTATREQWFALETFTATGEHRTWVGTVDGGALTWVLGPPLPHGAFVTALASTDGAAHAFGWDRATEIALAWSTDGSSWRPQELPSDFGGFPFAVAAVGRDVVAVGHSWTIRGDDPVIWHEAGGGPWQAEADPVIPRSPAPSGSACSGLPSDMIGWLGLDPATVVACMGDASITFRAWSSPCCHSQPDPGCVQGSCGRVPTGLEPAWLAAPNLNVLALAPTDSDWVPSTQVLLHPVLGELPPLAWSNTWLEVTGHYDDPAAVDCRWTPTTEWLAVYRGRAEQVVACRQQFVVTAVKVVSGP